MVGFVFFPSTRFQYVLFLAILAVIFYSFFDTDQIVIKDNSILKLSITGDVVEQRSQRDLFGDYAGRLLGVYEEPQETVLQDVLDAIAQAGKSTRGFQLSCSTSNIWKRPGF